jgi:hypothetical protein
MTPTKTDTEAAFDQGGLEIEFDREPLIVGGVHRHPLILKGIAARSRG